MNKKNKKDLKRAGLKVTIPRVAILAILESGDAPHLTAENIYKKLLENGCEIGLATVYRVLTQFEAAGIVVRHHFEGGHSVFELDKGEHHDHLVCIRCGIVSEFIDPLIEKQQKIVAEKNQFKMTDHLLYIYGLCKTCDSI